MVPTKESYRGRKASTLPRQYVYGFWVICGLQEIFCIALIVATGTGVPAVEIIRLVVVEGLVVTICPSVGLINSDTFPGDKKITLLKHIITIRLKLYQSTREKRIDVRVNKEGGLSSTFHSFSITPY